MTQWISREAIRAARRAPLYDYLLDQHSNDVIQEGDCLRLACNHSVSIKCGYSGYTDFATGDTGNAIDCLINYFGYDFQCAVDALCEFANIPINSQPQSIDLRTLKSNTTTNQARTPPKTATGAPANPPMAQPRVFVPPAPVQGPYTQLFAYLTQQRGIPTEIIQQLLNDGLLYQEAGHNNMVFIDPARTYAELRGTVPNMPFHGLVSGSDTMGFWCFKPLGPSSTATAAFICEAAIDAISLHLLRRRLSLPPGDNPMFCSIGGVANQQRIDRIKAAMDMAGLQTVLAVDNDNAGELCRQCNPDCYTLVPRLKDWNSDWLAAQKAG